MFASAIFNYFSFAKYKTKKYSLLKQRILINNMNIHQFIDIVISNSNITLVIWTTSTQHIILGAK